MSDQFPTLVYGHNRDNVGNSDEELLIFPVDVIHELLVFYEIITTAKTFGEYRKRSLKAILNNPRLENYFWEERDDEESEPFNPSDPFEWHFFNEEGEWLPTLNWVPTLSWVMVDKIPEDALDALDHLCGRTPLSIGSSSSDTMNIPWSKKNEAVVALEAAGFEVVEDQEVIDSLGHKLV